MSKSPRGGRQVIVDAAVTRFMAVGYHGASIRDIAAEANVTVASIYYHFASKQEILQGIMVAILSDVISETQQSVIQAGPKARDRLDALVRCWVLFHVRRQAEALIGASEIRSLDDSGKARIVVLRDQQESIFRSIVQDGVDSGEFKTPFPVEASRAIINMGRAVVTWYRADGPTSPMDMASEYAELALAMVRGD